VCASCNGGPGHCIYRSAAVLRAICHAAMLASGVPMCFVFTCTYDQLFLLQTHTAAIKVVAYSCGTGRTGMLPENAFKLLTFDWDPNGHEDAGGIFGVLSQARRTAGFHHSNVISQRSKVSFLFHALACVCAFSCACTLDVYFSRFLALSLCSHYTRMCVCISCLCMHANLGASTHFPPLPFLSAR